MRILALLRDEQDKMPPPVTWKMGVAFCFRNRTNRKVVRSSVLYNERKAGTIGGIAIVSISGRDRTSENERNKLLSGTGFMTIANAGKSTPFGRADTHWEKGRRPIDIAKSQAFIAGNEVHVWLAQIGFLPACQEVLSQEEVRQAASFRSPHDQDRYQFSHRLLRFLLAAYIEIQPSAIHFQKNRFGKPSLLHHDIPFALAFNMSHSRDHVCYVFARNRAVGIDLEFLDPDLEWDGVGQAVFSREEQDLLKSMPEAEQHRMFFQLWTRKEAQLKALGLGLAALDLEADRGERLAIENLQMQSFCYQDHYLGTVATDSDTPVVRFCSFNGQDAFMT